MKFLIFLFLIPLSLLAEDYQGTIYTWGYGELIKNTLDSIRMLIDGNGLTTIFKAALGIAFLLFAFRKMVDGKSNPAIEFGKMMLFATGVWYLFLTAPNDSKHRYLIEDKVTGDTYVVNQVPTGIGEPLQIFTQLEDDIIAKMEVVFSLPNSISYRNSGIGFPLKAQTTMAQLPTPDIYFQRTFKEFAENCTLYEIQDGSKDLTYIVSSNDLLSALDPNGDTRLTKVYTKKKPDGETKQCDKAYEDNIKGYIKNNGLNQQTDLASAMLGVNTDKFTERVNPIANLFFEATQSAREYLQQNFVINLAKKAFSAISATSGLSEGQLAYADAVTQDFAKTSFVESGILAGEYIPIIKGILLTIIVSLSWIMALLSIMFMDFRYIKMYFTLLLWLLLWSPIFVIINYIGDMYVSKIFTQIHNDTDQALTWFTSNSVNKQASSVLAWLGYLMWLVPPLAYAIAKASEQGFVSFASSIANTASRAAGAGAQAQLAQAQSTESAIRVGNETLTDKAGAITSQTTHNGYNETAVHNKDGTSTYSSQKQDGSASASVSLNRDGTLASALFTSQNIGANISRSLLDDFKQSFSTAKSALEQYQSGVTNSLSSTITNAMNSQKSLNIDASKADSVKDQKAITEAVTSSAEKVFGKKSSYQQQMQHLKQMAGSGSLGVSVKKLANGGFKYTFSNAKGDSVSFTATAQEAEKFNQAFSSSVSKSYATDEAFRQSFAKSVGVSDSKAFAQAAQEAKSYSEAYQKLQQAQEAYTYAQQHGANLSKNVLTSLFKDFYKEEVAKGFKGNVAIEHAMDRIQSLAENNELFSYLKDNGYLDEVKDKVTGKSNNLNTQVDENVDGRGDTITEIAKDNINHTYEEVKQNGAKTTNAVENGQGSIRDKINKDKTDIDTKSGNINSNNIDKDMSKLNNKVNDKVDENLLQAFLKDNSADIATLGGGMLGSALSGISDFNDLREALDKNGGKSPRNPRTMGGLSGTPKMETPKSGWRAGAGIAAVLTPTTIGGDYSEQLNSITGYKKDNDVVTSNEVSLTFNGIGGYQDEISHNITKNIDTDVNYKDWEKYVNENSTHIKEIFDTLKNKKINISQDVIDKIENAEKPQELDNILTQLAFSPIQQPQPTPPSNETPLTSNDTANTSFNSSLSFQAPFDIQSNSNSSVSVIDSIDKSTFSGAEGILGNQGSYIYSNPLGGPFDSVGGAVNSFNKSPSNYLDTITKPNTGVSLEQQLRQGKAKPGTPSMFMTDVEDQ